jgi:hypothetical protein
MCHMRRVPQARQEALRLRAMGLADVGQHRHGAVVGASIAGYLEGPHARDAAEAATRWALSASVPANADGAA